MSNLIRRFSLLVPLAVLPTLAGCGPEQYPVQGKVTLDDGTPLTKGMVVFESTDGQHMARGMVQPDGSYELSTAQPGDGLRPGSYRILVSPLDMADVPDEQKVLPFDIKYTRFQTSGLVAEVKARNNDVPIRLTRPSGRKKK